VVDANNGEYRIPASVVIEPDESVDIRYDVDSNGTGDLDYTEDNVVTVTPGGNDSSQPTTATNTTIIKGLTLVKTQALDAACDGNADGAFTTESIDADPNQCIIYNIDAFNTSTTDLGFDITNLVISDAKSQFNNAATYVDGSATTTGATVTTAANDDGTSITTTVSPLEPQQTATLQFDIKINNDPEAPAQP
jgi:hypothetical protein